MKFWIGRQNFISLSSWALDNSIGISNGISYWCRETPFFKWASISPTYWIGSIVDVSQRRRLRQRTTNYDNMDGFITDDVKFGEVALYLDWSGNLGFDEETASRMMSLPNMS